MPRGVPTCPGLAGGGQGHIIKDSMHLTLGCYMFLDVFRCKQPKESFSVKGEGVLGSDLEVHGWVPEGL